MGFGRMMGAVENADARFDASDWRPGMVPPVEDLAAVRARVQAGDVPRAHGATVDMAVLGRAYAGTWVGGLIRAVYDAGHDDGESCKGHDVQVAVESSRTLAELLAALGPLAGADVRLGVNWPADRRRVVDPELADAVEHARRFTHPADDGETVAVQVPRETAAAFVRGYAGPRSGPAWDVCEVLAAMLLTIGVEEGSQPGGWTERLTGREDLDAMRARFGWDAPGADPGLAGGGQ